MHAFALMVIESNETVGIVNMILPYVVHSCNSAMKGSLKERQSVLIHPFCHIPHFAFPGVHTRFLQLIQQCNIANSQSVYNYNALLPASCNAVLNLSM